MTPTDDPSPEPERPFASRLLDAHPGIREHVRGLPAFAAWKDTLKTIEVDGECLFVIGGDQLKDDDEIIVEWVRLHAPELLP
jgi:hypothetical protein